ncbi:hypothetical protein D3C78_1724210 [compost metagenome]
MANKYDEETREYMTLEMFNSIEVAVHGEQAVSTRKSYHETLPSPDIIAREVKNNGCDTFEVTHVTEKIVRYQV